MTPARPNASRQTTSDNIFFSVCITILSSRRCEEDLNLAPTHDDDVTPVQQRYKVERESATGSVPLARERPRGIRGNARDVDGQMRDLAAIARLETNAPVAVRVVLLRRPSAVAAAAAARDAQRNPIR